MLVILNGDSNTGITDNHFKPNPSGIQVIDLWIKLKTDNHPTIPGRKLKRIRYQVDEHALDTFRIKMKVGEFAVGIKIKLDIIYFCQRAK